MIHFKGFATFFAFLILLTVKIGQALNHSGLPNFVSQFACIQTIHSIHNMRGRFDSPFTMENLQITVTAANPLPIYRQVGEQVKEYIRAHSLREGTLLPDMRTLASLAGVSLQTADKALSELVKEGLCFRRPRKGTYVGRLNQTPPKKLCGIYHAKRIASFEHDLVQSAIYRGITSHAQKMQTDIFFITGDPQENIAFHSRHERLALSGILMLDWTNLEEVQQLATRFSDVRFVHLNTHLKGFEETPPNVFGVFNDDFAGGYQMTEHLAGRGHQRIAAFSLDLENENYRQRLDGYRQALLNASRRFDDGLVFSLKMPSAMTHREAGHILARRLLESAERVTAIFCVNDLLAAGVIEYLAEHRSAGPIEVCGHDHILSHLSQDLNFSTVHIDFEEMGRKALEIAMRHKRQYPKTLRLPPQLIARAPQPSATPPKSISAAPVFS